MTSSAPGFVLELGGGEHHLLLASMVKPRYPVALRCKAGTVWLAGDPIRGGVGAVPGGEQLFLLSHPIGKAEGAYAAPGAGDLGAASHTLMDLDAPGRIRAPGQPRSSLGRIPGTWQSIKE
jgi:hypothetical protein